jgi:HAMP domain-containing protein
VVATHQVLLLLTQMPEVRGDTETCRTFLADLRTSYPMYGNFNVIPPSGTVRCASLPSPTPVFLGDRSYFQRALETKSFAVGDFTIGRTTGRPSIVFALPLLDAEGEAEAVLSVGIDLTWLNRHLAEVQWPAGTTLTILDQSGTIVGSYPDATRIGGTVRNQPELESVLTAREGTGRRVGPDGRPVLLGFATSEVGAPAAQVHVIIGIPEDVAFSAADRQLVRGMGLVAGAALLAMLLAWLLGERLIAGPVDRIVQATAKIASGDLNAHTGSAHQDGELREIALAFDRMAGELQTVYRGTLDALTSAVEARDSESGGHVKRVWRYSLAIGRELQWTEKQLAQLQIAAAVHDISLDGAADAAPGVLGPSDPGALPATQPPPSNGAASTREGPFLAPALPCALTQHRYPDGLGSARAVGRDAISPEAMVVAIADTFDALTTNRPYLKGMTPGEAMAEIQRGAGTQFEPEMVAAFVRVVEAGAIAIPQAAESPRT